MEALTSPLQKQYMIATKNPWRIENDSILVLQILFLGTFFAIRCLNNEGFFPLS